MHLMLGNCLDQIKKLNDNSVDSIVTDPPYGLGFMNKDWDKNVPPVEIWQECLRVLKPGGHLLSFGGTRTYHRMAVAIEDAGFEIRDQIMWLYGSGFPKSYNVSKGIDKKFGVRREIVGINANHRSLKGTTIHGDKAQPHTGSGAITIPQTEEAKQWDGFGTALKPANEPIVLARKPLSEKTIVDNVLKWGTGAINADGCRVEGAFKSGWSKSGSKESENTAMSGKNYSRDPKPDNPQGRFPANVILDEIAGAELDKQSGIQKDGTGGASRFFYCAKASKSERNAGLEGMPEKESGVKNASGRGFSESDPYKKIKNQNHHPTVKPIKLMQYLTRLITPPGGVVLDPFMGSGSTGIAAQSEGFGFIGIELSEEYFEIAEKRING